MRFVSPPKRKSKPPERRPRVFFPPSTTEHCVNASRHSGGTNRPSSPFFFFLFATSLCLLSCSYSVPRVKGRGVCDTRSQESERSRKRKEKRGGKKQTERLLPAAGWGTRGTSLHLCCTLLFYKPGPSFGDDARHDSGAVWPVAMKQKADSLGFLQVYPAHCFRIRDFFCFFNKYRAQTHSEYLTERGWDSPGSQEGRKSGRSAGGEEEAEEEREGEGGLKLN